MPVKDTNASPPKALEEVIYNYCGLIPAHPCEKAYKISLAALQIYFKTKVKNGQLVTEFKSKDASFRTFYRKLKQFHNFFQNNIYPQYAKLINKRENYLTQPGSWRRILEQNPTGSEKILQDHLASRQRG